MIKFLTSSLIALFLVSCTAIQSTPSQASLVPTGMLKTRDYIITLYTSGSDQLYTVRAFDGTALQENLTIDSMIALYPELEYFKENDNITWAGLDINVEAIRIAPNLFDN